VEEAAHFAPETILILCSLAAFLTEITLLLGSNDFTQLTGPIFQSYLPKATNIYELDLSDNDFGDDGTSLVLSGLQQNSSIKRFVLEKNFKVRSKLRRKATMVTFYFASSSLCVNRSNDVFSVFRTQDLAAVINSEKCHLEYLSLANSGLRGDILDIFDSLGSNETLLKLDVSGNQFGDKGTYALSKGTTFLQFLLSLTRGSPRFLLLLLLLLLLFESSSSNQQNLGHPHLGQQSGDCDGLFGFFDCPGSQPLLEEHAIAHGRFGCLLKEFVHCVLFFPSLETEFVKMFYYYFFFTAHEARTHRLTKDISKTLALNQSPERGGVSKLERKQDQLLNSAQQDGIYIFLLC